MRLYLTRHGETDYNLKGLITGQIQFASLSDRGREQSERLAKRLFKEKIDIVYSSILMRSRETMEPYIRKREVVSVSTPLLSERCFGDFEGKPIDEYWSWVRENGYDGDPDFKAPGGESFSDLKERTRKLLSCIGNGEFENVLLNSRGGTSMALLSNLLGESETNRYRVDNCSLTVVDWTNGGAELALFNDVAHLEGL